MDWAAENPEVELDTSLRDLGISAYRGEHRVKGALASFLRRIERGDIPKGSYFLIESFDRLSRESETQAINLLTSITLAGVKVVTLTDKAIYDEHSDAMDLMRAIIVMSRAHDENRSRGKKVKDAWMEKKRRARQTGEIVSRRGPYWVEFNGKSFDLVPDRAAIVRRMFDEAIGGIGAVTISARLNAEGIKPFGKADGWHAHYILTTLHNRSCVGEYQPTNAVKLENGRTIRTPDGEGIPGYYPPVVSEDVFNRVQAIIHDRNRKGKGRGRRGKAFPNLLIGLGVCERCGGTVGIHSSGSRSGGPILRCLNAVRNHGCDNKRRYPIKPMEEELFLFLAKVRQREAVETPDEALLAAKIDSREELKRTTEILLDQVERGVPFIEERLHRRYADLQKIEKEIAEYKARVILSKGRKDSGSFVESYSQLVVEYENSRETPDENYRVRAKLNSMLGEFFDWIMPIEDGFYAGQGSHGWLVYRDGIAEFEIPEGTAIVSQELERIVGEFKHLFQ